MQTYFIYILTNKTKTVLYTGVTNNLKRRLYEHLNPVNESGSFTKKYKVYYLVYFEIHNDIKKAIEREKEIKGWRREKKNNLINSFNPEWKFFNDKV
jgi:putative endonuclease